MQTIAQVEIQIKNNTELLEATKQRIKETTTRLAKAQGLSEKTKADIKSAKEKRQSGLVKAENVSGLSADIAKFEKDSELFTEEIVGLQTFLAELQTEEASLHLTINGLPKRILQLRSLELAAEYNSLAEKMAPVVTELNTIWHKVTGNGNRKEDMVAHYPKDRGPFVEIPKIFYDDEGLNLEAYVAKFPNKYHSNSTLPSEERNFYSWLMHENKLRNG